MGALDEKSKTKGKAFVVDDEKDIGFLVKSYLEDLEYVVETFESAELAMVALEGSECELIVSDIKMKGMDGIGFLREVRRKSKVPFVLMTAHADILEASTAHEIGASDFILKPFNEEDFQSVIKIIEYDKAGEKIEGKQTEDFDYCRVHVDELVAGTNSFADIFLKLGADKYIRVAREDSPLSTDRINAYRSKGLEYLYVKKEDFANYVGLNLRVAKAVSGNKGFSREKKEILLKHSVEVMLQDAFVNGVDRIKMKDAKDLTESFLSVFLESTDIQSLFEVLKKNSDDIFSHSLGVSLYSVAIAKHWGWKSSSTISRIAMAGLFHDIGKKEIPREILTKSRVLMDTDEVLLYESHTIRGQEILSQIPAVPEEVATVAGQHHENLLGRGYPYRLSKIRIHPFAKIIGTVNTFCELVLPAKGAEKKPDEALNYLWEQRRDSLDPFTLKALMELFNFEVPPEIKGLRQQSLKIF